MSEEVVICDAVRTPVGRFNGDLKGLSAAALAEQVIRGLLSHLDLSGDCVDDVILGQCYPNGEAPAIGRVAALDAGLRVTTPGMQIDRRCGSGLMAIIVAAMQVRDSSANLILAGGVESMSQAEHYTLNSETDGDRDNSTAPRYRLTRARETAGGRFHRVAGGMLETAENLRRTYGISRAEQDELALMSHQRAVDARESGRFSDEIIPVTVSGTDSHVTVSRDEHPRADTTIDALGRLRPLLVDTDPEATVTAGNSSGQNDGAAICIVTTRSQAETFGLHPQARLVSWGVAGVAPEVMGIGPVPATRIALDRANLTLRQIELIECNEAFAAQVLAVTREWRFGAADFDRLNVNGSGISLGHPVGATGARIAATLLSEMHRRDVQYGLETMCIGGGQGLAAVFERIS